MKKSVTLAALRLHELFAGRRILMRMEALDQIQWLGRDALIALQHDKLRRLIEYAYHYVPYYRRVFNEIGFQPRDLFQDISCLSYLPILTKEIIRENYYDLLTTDPVRRRNLTKLSTSGSTGEPLSFMQDPIFREAVTAYIYHHMSWSGWHVGDVHAFIYGLPVNPTLHQKLYINISDHIWKRIQLDAFSMDEKSMSSFAKKLQRARVRVLYGYASGLYNFARFIRHNQLLDISFDGIYSTAEVLIPSVRQYIEETFRSKVYSRYGTIELGGVACECQAQNGYHISIENSYVEVINNGIPTKADEVGEIIVTNLNNWGMPFIRYSVGDVGAWSRNSHCSCGRTGPVLASVEGRLADSFQTRGGYRVWSGFTGVAFNCLAHPRIKQFQLVQKSLDKIVVRLVQDGDIPQSTLDEISRRLKSVFGTNTIVSFEFMDVIPALPSGKHRYAISELDQS